MTTESRQRASSFEQAEKENHNWYDCALCYESHLVHDDAEAFVCPNVSDDKPNAVLFHPNE